MDLCISGQSSKFGVSWFRSCCNILPWISNQSLQMKSAERAADAEPLHVLADEEGGQFGVPGPNSTQNFLAKLFLWKKIGTAKIKIK